MVDLLGWYSNQTYVLVYLLPRLKALLDLPSKNLSDQLVRKKRQAQTRLNPEQQLEMIKAYKNGKTVRQLTELFRVHKLTVLGHLCDGGIELRPYRKPPPDWTEGSHPAPPVRCVSA